MGTVTYFHGDHLGYATSLNVVYVLVNVVILVVVAAATTAVVASASASAAAVVVPAAAFVVAPVIFAVVAVIFAADTNVTKCARKRYLILGFAEPSVQTCSAET